LGQEVYLPQITWGIFKDIGQQGGNGLEIIVDPAFERRHGPVEHIPEVDRLAQGLKPHLTDGGIMINCGSRDLHELL
jgi:hypothetical protein